MQVTSKSRIDIPDSLRQKLLAFRRRVWTIKLIEAFAGAVIGVLIGYLLMYGLDRLLDTPQAVRWAIFAIAVISCTLIPAAIDRWIYRRRRLDQLACLLSQHHPAVGDQLLGIIELAESDSEQARSPALVQAAIRQVSEVAQQRDFRNAVPNPKHHRRTWTAVALGAAAAVLLLISSAAATNAWARFLKPWADTPRYTFAAVDGLQQQMVVPHGETFPVTVQLADAAEWRPSSAELRVPGHPPLEAALEDGKYRFEVPGQISPATLNLTLGDFTGQTHIEPVLRPELKTLSARVVLPGYLERSEPIVKDIRGGSLVMVKGSKAEFTAVVTRKLSQAAVDQQSRAPQGEQFATGDILLDGPRELELSWTDHFGLAGHKPFKLTVEGAPDEAPSLVCENLPRQQVLLDTEVLTFQVRARDDFGVKRVGIEWEGLDTNLPNPAKGEQIIGAGSSTAELLELAATFSASQLEIQPQPVAVRVFVEDYLPGRERIYSPTSVFEILNAEQHAIWIVSQLSRWHRMSLDVRDREMQLHEVNKELRGLPADELDHPDTRRRIESQASAERSNARRLGMLTSTGEELLKQAMRNPEIGVGHLEKWAEMMQILKDISANRMPSVSDLLKDAAAAPQVAQYSPGKAGPKAGQDRGGAPPGESKKSTGEPPPAVPSISDSESSHQQAKTGEPKPPSETKAKQPRLTLPVTTLAGKSSDNAPKPPAGEKVDQAVEEQKDLLAEFEKITDELNTVLANLEGSTLVKRLKASSRRQHQVATKLASLVSDAFGVAESSKTKLAGTFEELANVEADSSQDLSDIMDDMSAYFERSRFMRFKVVLDEMRKQDVTAGLRQLGDDLRKENGLSVAQAEYWSETLDRWAEDLVEVCKSGACPGGKSKGSLPPSIVLEVLQILESEVSLREETRVAEQAKAAVTPEEHEDVSTKLSTKQATLRERVDKVVSRIRELPDSESDFAKEIALLSKVSSVMGEATDILASSNTGSQAIAAETEAIELLLQSKRINPNGGGGSGGANPGGGGGGTTTDSALALVGAGVNDKEVREDRGVQQTTGTTGPELPEEYRAGLDEYFNRLDTVE